MSIKSDWVKIKIANYENPFVELTKTLKKIGDYIFFLNKTRDKKLYNRKEKLFIFYIICLQRFRFIVSKHI